MRTLTEAESILMPVQLFSPRQITMKTNRTSKHLNSLISESYCIR